MYIVCDSRVFNQSHAENERSTADLVGCHGSAEPLVGHRQPSSRSLRTIELDRHNIHADQGPGSH